MLIVATSSAWRKPKKGDARITPVGRFIRRTSIDELPQLISVIKGDMSFIGPRPHPIGMLAAGQACDALVPYYHDRRAMKPEISGWAQADGLRGTTENARVAAVCIEHDVDHVQNFSILLDIKIIFLTIRNEFITWPGN
ncbi:MAG: sugar transferase [Candidatus Devosia euplotis]|nr:sugar transferase [Candidatus Devosia euplotis]